MKRGSNNCSPVWLGYCSIVKYNTPVLCLTLINNQISMIYYIKRIVPLAFALAIMATSCTETKTNTQEQTEIKAMDSTSKTLKETTDKLEDQTKKVEASLEKLDKEFETNK